MDKNLKRACIFIFFPLLLLASFVFTANQTALAEGRKLSSDGEKIIDYYNNLLSNTDKLITNYMIQIMEREGGYSTIAKAVKALKIDHKTLDERLAYLKKVGILVSAKNSLKYSLIFNYKTWGGPLRYNSHIIDNSLCGRNHKKKKS